MVGIYPANVLHALNKAILRRYKFIKHVTFDPNLSYSTSLQNNRLNSVFIPKVTEKTLTELPMLSWNRDQLSKVSRPFNLKCSQDLHNVDFVVAQFNYSFSLYTTNIEDLEQFELEWMLRKSINSVNEININHKLLNEQFTFSIKWEDNLNSLTFSVDSDYYKSITGSALISGVFILARELTKDEESKIINSLDIELSDCSSNYITKEIISERS